MARSNRCLIGKAVRAALLAGVLALTVIPGAALAAGNRAPGPRLALTHGNNVYLQSVDGGSTHAVTTRGSGGDGPGFITYPWYSWSPDGRYLLLVRMHDYSRWDILLLNAQGALVRTLASNLYPGDFYPSWAQDADTIVYTGWERQAPGNGGLYHAVYQVDVQGHKRFLWKYDSHEACGCGFPFATNDAYWQTANTAPALPSMQWSVAQHRAVYSASFGGGLNVTDTRTGATQRLGGGSVRWSAAALSSTGRLAVAIAATNGGEGQIALTSPTANAPVRILGSGESPVWSRDGRFLYFVRRTHVRRLDFVDAYGRSHPIWTYTSTIWRVNADGSHARQLFSTAALRLAYLNPTADGGLIFQRAGNALALWQHRLPGNRVTDAMVQRYAPAVSVQRLAPNGAVSTLAPASAAPAVSPA